MEEPGSTPKVSRRRVLAGLGGATVAAVVGLPAVPRTAAAATAAPLPLPPLRIPQVDLGVEQQPDHTLKWLRDAKLGMFLHWGVYSGPAKGEWYMHNAPVSIADYRKYCTDATPQQFTASSYDPAAWAQLAKDMGAKYTVLTTRHHDGFALWPATHPDSWDAGEPPLRRDFVGPYVAAVRNAGLRVGLYYSPINWRFPGYYDVRGTGCASNPWGYTTDPAHRENARIMKNVVYQEVRELVSQYGAIDDFWWDGGWIAEQGTDRDGAFFWEPGGSRDPANEWPVDAAYAETDANGTPLGLMGLVRKHQPNVVATSRSGWLGDYGSDEGGSVPTGKIRPGLVEKVFTIGGAWGYVAGAPVMSFEAAMDILVNSWVRDLTCMVNVGPDRTGVVPADQQAVVKRIGAFLAANGTAVYGTRGGPFQPVDGQYGFTYSGNTFYVHLLPGYSGTGFTTPPVGDAVVTRVFDVAAGTNLPFSTGSDGRVTVSGIDRTRWPVDTVVGVTLDRPVVPADIAAGRSVAADSQQAGHPASLVTDGDGATRWSAADDRAGHWITVDLGAAKPVTGVRLAWEQAANYRYRVDGSTDNRNWATLADNTATASTAQVQTLPVTGTVRYVRVTVTALPAGQWASIREIEVYDRPFAASVGDFRLVNRRSGKVLEVPDAATADGAPVAQWTYNGGAHQHWTLTTDAAAGSRLVNVHSGKVLESPGGSGQGAQLDQWPGDGGDNQVWRIVSAATAGYVNLVNVRTGWYADVTGASAADGAAVIQWPPTGGANQDWQLVAV